MTIQQIIGHKGEIIWDKNKPDGTPRKFLDSSKLNLLSWNAKIELQKGISLTYKSFLSENKY